MNSLLQITFTSWPCNIVKKSQVADGTQYWHVKAFSVKALLTMVFFSFLEEEDGEGEEEDEEDA